jgi:fatty-acyl-CoA synthase
LGGILCCLFAAKNINKESTEFVVNLVTKAMSGSPRVGTPRANKTLIQNLAGFETLAEGLDYAAKGETGLNFYSSRGALEHVVPYSQLRESALAAARRLVSLNLQRGSRVAVVAESGPDFMAVFFGCQYAGLVPCPMPYSVNMGGKDAYIERVAGMLAAADASIAITTEDLHGAISAAASRSGGIPVLSFAELGALAERAAALEPFGPGDVAYIQYSSGSTSAPKGVLITQRAIVANTRGILRGGLKLTPDDRAFSWLPLYHDMGLVGFCLAPMMGQVTIDYLATTAFARRPALWLKLMSDNKTTITFAPSFGYDLAARRINGDAASLDLSRVRIAGIGGDMVRPDVLRLFAEKLAVAKFDPKAFLPSYGMAEATLAITFTDLDAPVRIDTVNRIHYKLARRAVPMAGGGPSKSRDFVSCGRPLPGHEVIVLDDQGERLADRAIGRVCVKGPSLMAGYYNDGEATADVMRGDGFMDTGDMGYWLDGEIVITGRVKDLILHNGRNIWPQDIEWAAEHIEPLRDGDVAAFAVEGDDGDDDVVVLLQCRLSAAEEMEALRRKVGAAVHQAAGVECRIVLVPPKSLPYTSSGKLSRAGARAKYLAGDIAEIAPESPALQRPEERLEAAQ